MSLLLSSEHIRERLSALPLRSTFARAAYRSAHLTALFKRAFEIAPVHFTSFFFRVGVTRVRVYLIALLRDDHSKVAFLSYISHSAFAKLPHRAHRRTRVTRLTRLSISRLIKSRRRRNTFRASGHNRRDPFPPRCPDYQQMLLRLHHLTVGRL